MEVLHAQGSLARPRPGVACMLCLRKVLVLQMSWVHDMKAAKKNMRAGDSQARRIVVKPGVGQCRSSRPHAVWSTRTVLAG